MYIQWQHMYVPKKKLKRRPDAAPASATAGPMATAGKHSLARAPAHTAASGAARNRNTVQNEVRLRLRAQKRLAMLDTASKACRATPESLWLTVSEQVSSRTREKPK
jgi:hypothetical protein